MDTTALRDELIAKARSLGVSVEEHAAAEITALKLKYGSAVFVAAGAGLVLGFIIAKVL